MFKTEKLYNDIHLVKITIACIVGILIAIYFQSFYLSIFLLFPPFILVILFMLKMISTKLKYIYLLKKILFYLVPLAFICLGYFLSICHTDISNTKFYGNYLSRSENYIEAKIKVAAQEKTNSYKVIVEVEKVKNNDTFINTSGKLLLYFQKDSLVKELKPNDKIFIKSKINSLEKPKNPNEFDFKNYLQFQNIYYQTYLKSENWSKSYSSKNKITNTLFIVKQYLQKIINENIFDQNERAVASALLLGNRTYLTEDILRAFSSSGATHILAVSGLHVGLFYGIISFLFSFLKKTRRFKFLHPVIIILFIWFYVILTGGSASVVRAATMFSFVAIGLSLSRYINIYNIIALSALLIIVFNPFIITEVGFQLSYFAVIGIIYLQQKIYRLLYIKNYLGDKIWAITSVSLAAQISTFPLIVLYFHQFPNFFWLSNIIVIPAASIILYSGILMFIFSWNETILSFIGNILSYIIKALNFSLNWLEKIPNAVWDKLYISYFQAVCLYIAIILFVICIEKRSKNFAFAFIIILGIIIISFNIKTNTIINQNKLSVYHVPGYSAIEIIDGSKAYHKIDSSLLKNENLLNFRIKHNWWEKQLVQQNFSFNELNTITRKGIELLYYKDKKIAIIDDKYKSSNLNLDLDFLIISNTPNMKFKALSTKVKAKTYIFDTSNNKYKEKYWKQDCKELKLDCYFVSDTIAFEIDL
ncbi:MAG: ComEC/Rec2 family competence protein [Chitinophagales bacterium]